MARIRNIKPGFFKDADLYDAEKASGLPLRIAYAGLWTVADRAGRFKWKPREIGTDILPYDNVDMNGVMEALVKYGFIFKYRAAGFEYGYIPNFEKHQFINRNEAQSTLPAPTENSNAQSEPNSAPITNQQPPLITSELLVVLDTDTDGLTQTQEGGATSSLPAKTKRKSSIPEHFPSEDDREAATKHWLSKGRPDLVASLDEETAQFRDRCASDGVTALDWPAKWRTWYRNTPKFNHNRPGKVSAHDRGSIAAAEILAEIRAEDASDEGGHRSPIGTTLVALPKARYG